MHRIDDAYAARRTGVDDDVVIAVGNAVVTDKSLLAAVCASRASSGLFAQFAPAHALDAELFGRIAGRPVLEGGALVDVRHHDVADDSTTRASKAAECAVRVGATRMIRRCATSAEHRTSFALIEERLVLHHLRTLVAQRVACTQRDGCMIERLVERHLAATTIRRDCACDDDGSSRSALSRRTCGLARSALRHR